MNTAAKTGKIDTGNPPSSVDTETETEVSTLVATLVATETVVSVIVVFAGGGGAVPHGWGTV
ncbi:MAG: hypothetical protein ACW99A_13070, partial [Candidatus Kariarchaeaceae archaeon]